MVTDIQTSPKFAAVTSDESMNGIAGLWIPTAVLTFAGIEYWVLCSSVVSIQTSEYYIQLFAGGMDQDGEGDRLPRPNLADGVVILAQDFNAVSIKFDIFDVDIDIHCFCGVIRQIRLLSNLLNY